MLALHTAAEAARAQRPSRDVPDLTRSSSTSTAQRIGPPASRCRDVCAPTSAGAMHPSSAGPIRPTDAWSCTCCIGDMGVHGHRHGFMWALLRASTLRVLHAGYDLEKSTWNFSASWAANLDVLSTATTGLMYEPQGRCLLPSLQGRQAALHGMRMVVRTLSCQASILLPTCCTGTHHC